MLLCRIKHAQLAPCAYRYEFSGANIVARDQGKELRKSMIVV